MSSAGVGRVPEVFVEPGRVWGAVPGIREGTAFASRREAYDRGVHLALQAGIVGVALTGAASIVLSGGYEDVDGDDWILYTGHGGRKNRKQVDHQTFNATGNAALVASRVNETPVRVIRGAEAKFGPDEGYRYDGLFLVKDSYYEVGGEGYKMCRFLMIKYGSEVDVSYPDVAIELSPVEKHPVKPAGKKKPARRSAVTKPIVRSLEVSDFVKQVHNHTCQICNVRLVVKDQGYSQGAHIQALGGVQAGPDVPENVLCLCPNCHSLFDMGAILVQPDHALVYNGKNIGKLRLDDRHYVDDKYLTFHREIHS
ncbi:YDG/SRA domain-containing protein [Amycolatopsis sp. NPDC051128]|uniref:YDG/SRA domain-containing protein n=1 Tax=Amycolatopsis sp. NPDC051128 TaxID=3155412 RepID=UPI0034182DAF